MLKKVLVMSLLGSILACSFSGNVNPTNQNDTKDKTSNDKKSDTKNQEPEKLKSVAVSKVQITSGDNLVVNEGDKLDIQSNVIYEDNSRDSAISWSSSDNTIVSVNPTTGSVSGVKAGITTVIATSLKDTLKKASTTVTVKKADVVEALTKITPKEATIKVGETVRLDAKIQMSDGTFSPNVIWKSDNTGIALVSNGLVTAVGEGTTTITAIASGDSTKKASSKITVLSDSPQVSTSPIVNK